MGNYGFDLISWYTLKNWLETREKLLATRRSFTFDERTQILRMFPQPRSNRSNIRFYGVITDMSEDYPPGMQHPKYGVSLQVEHVSEFSGTSGTVIGDGVLMSLGGEIIDEPKYSL